MPQFSLTAGLLLLSGSVVAQTSVVSPSPAAPANPVPVRAARVAAPLVTGRVTDAATGEVLPGATVVFPDLRRTTAAGTDGTFQFANLPRGRFLMQVRFVGYTAVVRTIDTGTGQPLEIALTPAETEIGQVVVTGVSASTEMRRSPIPTNVVDQTRLRQTAFTNAIDAIAHTPGLNQITTGAAISKPVIRG
ncbi:carboxypeptidase-like regulatory domain-containing protein [Hymenobacter sp. 5516J-16]|uniref:carboxypeptidase-like regulatory domain-containing protein n=1 Tax=Hymenobacter sp. 5516J-16 TaxID=2932253 RepID=UPI001FD4BB7B|nr:carboxypeptidase-like regulatory domain-containing protein [Hymenobacter sp. 5516J-16]UOQ75675.1 carboxypeptidase-like regulatory domain-containing protein [Hymenobacter sp. 5516J-16]